jgi:hypothetical protein
MQYTPLCPHLPADKCAKAAALLILLIIAVFTILLQPALAANVSNLTDRPQQIEVKRAGGFVPAVIPARETFSVPGNIDLRFRGRELFLETHEEYAIWPDGTFGPQRRMQGKHGGW